MNSKRLWVALVGSLVVALLPVPASSHTSGSVSDWRPGCGFYWEGRPFGFYFPFCEDTYGARIRNDYNHGIFGRAGMHVTTFDDSERGYRLWGRHGDDFSKLVSTGNPLRRGTGAPLDPFELDVPVAVGDQLVVHQFARYRDGTNEMDMAWDVVNVSDEPVRFRLTIAAESGSHCGYGELRQDPLEIGTYLPDEEAPHDNECANIRGGLGRALYAHQHSGSPWSAYQHGTYGDVQMRLGEGRSLSNAHSPGLTPWPTVAFEWDDHGQGGAPLAPGATAHYSATWRFHTSLASWPFLEYVKRRRVPLKLTTEWARGGPRRNHRIGVFIQNEQGESRTRFVRTNDKGRARMTVRVSRLYETESVRVFFDSNGDGRLQPERELSRGTIMLTWDPDRPGPYWERFRSSLTFEREGSSFHGRVRSEVRAESTQDRAVDCRKHRVVAIRRKRPGRDETIASAVSDGRGRWDLTVDAPAGSYYGRLLGEERSYGDGSGSYYFCRGATAP